MKDIQQGGHACNHQNLYHSFPSCIKLIFIVHNVTGPEKNQYYLHKIHLFILEQLSLFIMCYTKSRCRPVFAWFLKLDSVQTCMSVCMRVYVFAPEAINNQWHDMNAKLLVK